MSKMSKFIKYSLTEDKKFLIQEMRCTEPMVAIKMHEHVENRGGHLTKVLSGGLFIHDDADWNVTLKAGETLDLMHVHLKHEILATESETVFQNWMPAERFSERDIENFMEINREVEALQSGNNNNNDS